MGVNGALVGGSRWGSWQVAALLIKYNRQQLKNEVKTISVG